MRLAEPGRAWGDSTAVGAKVLRMDEPANPPQPFRSLRWTGWTMCHTGQFPAPGTRCYLRVRVSLDLGNDLIEEVWAAYDPVGWLPKSGARITEGVIAWRPAEAE